MIKKTVQSAPFVLLGLLLLGLLFLNLFYQDHWLDSDMAAEMIFSRLLAEEGSLFATQEWYYSTEFRVLYTQLVMMPLFLILDNWHVIRLITNLVSYVLMIGAYFYMMRPLGVKSRWTALTGAVLLLPFSETMMTHMQMGNTYMPHVILLLFFFGMFLRLAEGKHGRARKWEMGILYTLLALVCGVSGVRYLLAMQCPLLFSSFLYLLGSEEFQAFRRRFGTGKEAGVCWKKIGKSSRAPYFYYSLLGAAAGVAGYGVNVLWVSRRYVFQTYESTNFIAVYQGILWERVQNAFGSLLMLFGYIPDKSFLSLRGLISLLAFVMIGVFGYCGVKMYRRSSGRRFFTVLFTGVSLGLNLFVFIFTSGTMVPRYYITILVFALPVLAFYFESGELPFDRFAAAALLGLSLCLGTAKVTFSFITVDKNAEKREAAAFLEENGYDFGFATYWNANIMTELTDGAVEIANVNDPETLEFFRWSSPMKYYEEGYHQGRTFLLLTAQEAEEYGKARSLLAGEPVYEDAYYSVYEYGSVEELLQCVPEVRTE